MSANIANILKLASMFERSANSDANQWLNDVSVRLKLKNININNVDKRQLRSLFSLAKTPEEAVIEIENVKSINSPFQQGAMIESPDSIPFQNWKTTFAQALPVIAPFTTQQKGAFVMAIDALIASKKIEFNAGSILARRLSQNQVSDAELTVLLADWKKKNFNTHLHNMLGGINIIVNLMQR